ncbi:MAG: guanylate kinase [Patescibacteria group bacterium]|nr:guanylate kinase [Patescibacteria group bacterium]
MENQYTVFILSGPSGVGKTTVWDEIRSKHVDRVERIVTTTTRAPRPGEVHGTHYYFLSKGEFESKIVAGEMIEYALVHGNYYGSSSEELERIVSHGKNPVYIVDPQGMAHLRPELMRRGYRVSTVFLMPPSIDELKSRLRGRGTEDDDSLNIRLANAMVEMEEKDFYDYQIVNDALENAVAKVGAVMFARS